MAQQILQATETTGSAFRVPGGRVGILFEDDSGGTWTLQVRRSGGSWVSTTPTFTDNGVKFFVCSYELEYRLNGGTVGAQAHLVFVNYPGFSS